MDRERSISALSAPQQPRGNASRSHWLAAASRDRAAFTLIEMIVVIMVLAILGSMIVPRLVNNERRQFRVAAEKVADLLTMYAQRENLGQKVVGIYHDRNENLVRLIIIDVLDPDHPERSDWRIEPFVNPVRFPDFMHDSDIEFFADGQSYDASQWPLASEIGQARPAIDIVLRAEGETARIALAPHAVAPIIVHPDFGNGILRERVDLEASGRSREDW